MVSLHQLQACHKMQWHWCLHKFMPFTSSTDILWLGVVIVVVDTVNTVTPLTLGDLWLPAKKISLLDTVHGQYLRSVVFPLTFAGLKVPNHILHSHKASSTNYGDLTYWYFNVCQCYTSWHTTFTRFIFIKTLDLNVLWVPPKNNIFLFGKYKIHICKV